MYVGLASFKNASGQYAIFGDADGNGNPGGASPQMAAMGGVDSPNMGGEKAVAVAFAPFNSSNPDCSGHSQPDRRNSADKSLVGNRNRRLQGRGIQQQLDHCLQNAFGSTISGVTGNLAFNPSATNPELEFSISNFSKSGINPTQGFWVEMYAGSGQDVVAGEAGLVWTYVPPFEPQQIPEPATWIVWAGLAGGFAWRRIRSRRASA